MPESLGFVFNTFRDFIRFVEYAGGSAVLEIAAPILDKTGATLIQKGLIFRESMMKNLWNFFNQSNLDENFAIVDSSELRSALGAKIRKTLLKCLEPGRFHIAHNLTSASNLGLVNLVTSLTERRDILPILLKIAQAEDPILPHLGEVALAAGGFAEQYMRGSSDDSETREIVRSAILAGLLHDFNLANDDDFLAKDIEFIRESGHAEKSAQQIQEILPDLSSLVVAAISEHHRDRFLYNGEDQARLKKPQIITESVALAEFIFVQLRSQYKKDETMNSAELLFYELGKAFGRGLFHSQFKRVAANLWENLFATLNYGYEIGRLEASCPHRPSAVAYPVPLATQIMCRHNVSTCKHFDSHFPLEIIQPMRYPGKPGEFISAGKYAKCQLASALPQPTTKRVASGWMAKGNLGNEIKPNEPEA